MKKPVKTVPAQASTLPPPDHYRRFRIGGASWLVPSVLATPEFASAVLQFNRTSDTCTVLWSPVERADFMAVLGNERVIVLP